MNEAGFNELIRRIKEAKASGETDTKLGKVMDKWKDIDIPIWRDGKWLLEGFIMTFKRDLEILSAIDPSISPLHEHRVDQRAHQRHQQRRQHGPHAAKDRALLDLDHPSFHAGLMHRGILQALGRTLAPRRTTPPTTLPPRLILRAVGLHD